MKNMGLPFNGIFGLTIPFKCFYLISAEKYLFFIMLYFFTQRFVLVSQRALGHFDDDPTIGEA
jgi:hypothetical protein